MVDVQTHEMDAKLAPVIIGLKMFKLGNHDNQTILV
jgi:hypothetical protein